MSAHTCHALGCTTAVPPRLFVCPKHWRKLPNRFQRLINVAYVPGQEIRKDPTPTYLAVQQVCVAVLGAIDGLPFRESLTNGLRLAESVLPSLLQVLGDALVEWANARP